MASMSEKERDAVMSEVDILGRLSHPNIIRLVHPWSGACVPFVNIHHKNRFSFIEGNVLHIFTDYADQGDLNTKIMERVWPRDFKIFSIEMHSHQSKTGDRFKESQVLDWFLQISLGVKCIHDHNIIHRDLKVH